MEQSLGWYITVANEWRLARHAWTGDDIEIDDNPEVIVGDDGAWVAAWVWIPNPEEQEDAETITPRTIA